jgi:endonuclease IV
VIGCAQDRSMIAEVRNVVHAGYIIDISSNKTGIANLTQTFITNERLGNHCSHSEVTHY